MLGSGGYGGSTYGSSYGGGYGGGGMYGSSYGGAYGASRYGGGYGGYGGSSSYGSGYGGAYGSSRYGSSRYGGGYGASSMYGSSYGGGGGGYGAYNRGSLGAGPRGPGEGGPGVVTWIDQFSQVVDTFGRFAHLLDMNCDALYGSFSSVLRLFESMSELRRELLFIFQTVTLYRLLKSVLGRVGSVGRLITGGSTASVVSSSSTSGLDLDSFQHFQGKDQAAPRSGRRFWPFLLFLISAIGGPLIINRLWRMLRAAAAAAQQPQQQLADEEREDAPIYVQALYDFVGSGSEGDLQFGKGALIRVLRADPDQGWWEGETGGRVGLFPAMPCLQGSAPPRRQNRCLCGLGGFVVGWPDATPRPGPCPSTSPKSGFSCKDSRWPWLPRPATPLVPFRWLPSTEGCCTPAPPLSARKVR